MRRLLPLALLAGLLLLRLSAVAAAPEYQVKAAFLYNFARFVEWPPDVVERHPTFRICVMGEDPFGTTLVETVRGKTVLDRPVEIGHPDTTGELAECMIVFVPGSESAELPRLIAALAGSSALTVGETDGFAYDGGIIGMRVEAAKVRFEVNADAAQRARLKISSQLLKLATRVIQ
ncbi:MAG TPA: YfiR family protein [Candidatus Binatia bacterium]|nr:YfiR family protein [Candidatus Binatia bacterium]